jgi:hypothetical protein
MGGRIEMRNLDVVLRNITNLPAEIVKEKIGPAAGKVSEELDKTIKKYAELTDHSLDDLARMGHPYARYIRNGSGKIVGMKSEDSGPHPDEFVHKQSGTLYNNIEKVIDESKAEHIRILGGVSKSKVPYIDYLLDGTSKMRSRDFEGHAFQECKDKLVSTLKEEIENRRR